jgi:hypothetical protein
LECAQPDLQSIFIIVIIRSNRSEIVSLDDHLLIALERATPAPAAHTHVHVIALVSEEPGNDDRLGQIVFTFDAATACHAQISIDGRETLRASVGNKLRLKI